MASRRMWSLARIEGFSVAEVTTILSALSILSGVAAPAVNDYVEQAKLIRASHDVKTLNVSLARLFNDTASQRNIAGGWATYDLLVGGGSVPQADGAESARWATPAGPAVGTLDDQLLANGAGYSTGHKGWSLGWRGAYLETAVKPDPWGQRYAVNVQSMRTAGADTVVISAGPDGIIESVFELDGLPTKGDDIASLVSSGVRGQ